MPGCTPAVRLNVPVPVSGDVPPLPLTTMDPEPPLQTASEATAETVRAEGSNTVALAEAWQPPPSVTLNVYVPRSKSGRRQGKMKG